MTVRLSRRIIQPLQLRDLALIGVVLFLLGDRAMPSVRALAQSGPAVIAAAGDPQTGFTYQGRLAVDGVPANGPFQVRFKLWNAQAAGSTLATYEPPVAVPVANGLFTTLVDFALPFSEGQQRWIELEVRPGGSADPFVSLGRTLLTVSPHDHLYQDWIGSSANAGLTLRNLGSGDALYLEAGAGNALEATASGSAPTLLVSNQGAGSGIVVNTSTGEAAVQGISSQGVALAGTGFKTGLAAVVGVHGGDGCSSLVTNERVSLGNACIGTGGVADTAVSGGIGVYGGGSSWGVLGRSLGGVGVRGEGWNSSPAIEGANSSSGCAPAVAGSCAGVHGVGEKRGVVGTTNGFCNSTASISSVCIGVQGEAVGGSASIGVYGKGSFAGVYGDTSGGAPYAGYFNGNVFLAGAIIPPSSDRKLKHSITPTSAGLDEVLALRPSTYAWNDPAPWDEEGRVHNGFIAQEVREVLPSAVYIRDESGTLGLDYNEITAVLVKAVQEQNATIEELRDGALARSVPPGNAGRPASTVPFVGTALAAGLAAIALAVALGRRGARAANGPRARE